MAETIIFEGERETRFPGRVTVDCDSGKYEVRTGSGKSVRKLTFDYVGTKSLLLAQWLREHGVGWPNPNKGWKGQPQGYKYYAETVDKVEVICQLLRIDCEVCLHPDLIGWEDSASFVNGELRIIERMGRHIKFHVLRKRGNRIGRRVEFGEVFESLEFHRWNDPDEKEVFRTPIKTEPLNLD